jgi:hypothetical protein
MFATKRRLVEYNDVQPNIKRARYNSNINLFQQHPVDIEMKINKEEIGISKKELRKILEEKDRESEKKWKEREKSLCNKFNEILDYKLLEQREQIMNYWVCNFQTSERPSYIS